MFLRSLVATLLLIFLLTVVPAARAGDVAILLSNNGGAYAEFAVGFQQFIASSQWRVRWVGNLDSIDSLPRTDLILAVGSEATRIAFRRNAATPVVATLLPRPAYDRALSDIGGNRPKGTSTAIFLDQPVARLLSFIRHVVPERTRVGLLAGAETRSVLPQIRQAASTLGLTIEIEDAGGTENPVPALNHLLPRSDVLLALPESSVYRRDSIRAILLSSYRYQRPVIGFSQSLVTSGALAAVYSTPTQIARQAAELVTSLHPDGSNLPPPQAPNLFAIAINHNVAQALGLTIPEESVIRRAMAADKDTHK